MERWGWRLRGFSLRGPAIAVGVARNGLGDAGAVFLGGEGFQDFGAARLGRRILRRRLIRRCLREVVPDEGFYVGLDDDVGLSAPGEVGVALDDGKERLMTSAAVRGSSRLPASR